jgi:hypothetical protein
VAVHWGALLRIDYGLHLDIASGVGEEAADLTQRDRSDAFEPGDPAAES